jgi:2-dehydro-3-deoxyphosphogluconate aldolase / (4S)-4-hydroxy-2-oxoglutarate aldolase
MDDEVLARIGDGRIIAILRGDFRGLVLEIASVLYESGITAIEVTMNSPDALVAIERLTVGIGDKLSIGAGTVLSEDQVLRAASRGARFIVSPNRHPNVIATTKRSGLISIPGCFTPSEICEALYAGADAVKLFPASSISSSFVRAIRNSLGDVRMIPTGGVNPEVAREYVIAGAWALGVGSELVSSDVLAVGGLVRLRAAAEAFVKAVRPPSSRSETF